MKAKDFKAVYKAAIFQSTENGFKSFTDLHEMMKTNNPVFGKMNFKKFVDYIVDNMAAVSTWNMNKMYFNHDFAKAFFGNKWEERLKDMVLHKDTVSYIKKHINKYKNV